MSMLKSGAGRIRVTGPPGQRFRLLTTTDSRTWEVVAELTNKTGVVEYVDVAANGMTSRFCRVELTP